MADVVYKVEFELNETVADDNKEATETVPKSPLPQGNKDTVKKLKLNKRHRRTIAFSMGVAKLTYGSVVSERANAMALRGDTLAAKRYQEKHARIDKYASTAFTMGMGFMMKGTLGFIAIGFEAFRLASEAIKIGIENRYKLAQFQMEKYVSVLESERFVRNATTEALKW